MMKRTIVDENGQREVDIPAAEAAALQAAWASQPPPPAPPQPTLAELEAQLEALAAQIAAMKQNT
jgi:hypothetical protein